MLFGVISFPGTNCEQEAVRAFKSVGFDSKILLWNEPEESFDACDGFLIAGGFSYEDRGRSGVVSANDHACDYLRKAAKAGKPIIGVCNGAQILVETGLVTDSEGPEIALSINKRVKDGEVQGVGFYHDWCVLKNVAKVGRSPFNNTDELVKMPLAHGEGRFVISDEKLKEMKANDQIVYLYATEDGDVDTHYPTNPNGSFENIAGVCNKQGNVLAMMPHPERDPKSVQQFFGAIKSWVDSNSLSANSVEQESGMTVEVQSKKQFPIELYIETIITDNDCETIRSAIERKLGEEVEMKRLRYFGAELDGDLLTEAAKIVETDEIANTNKEVVYAKTTDGYFKYAKGKGFEKVNPEDIYYFEANNSSALIAVEKEDIFSQSKLPKLQHEGVNISILHGGICWILPQEKEEKAIATGILANPVSMYIEK